ncbi:hypothetical protein Csa_001554, partial [Cucumis sativus]
MCEDTVRIGSVFIATAKAGFREASQRAFLNERKRCRGASNVAIGLMPQIPFLPLSFRISSI